MKVAKWGNSLAVRLPAELVARLGLVEGDEIQIIKACRERLEVERTLQVEEALRRIRDLPNKLPSGYKFDRMEAYPARRGGPGTDDE
jgi:antitoxin MazE